MSHFSDFRFRVRAMACFSAIVALFFLFSINTAFAEDPLNCKGVMSGISLDGNSNSGNTSFEEGRSVDLSIIGLGGSGYAPSTLRYAACVDDVESTWSDVADDDKYSVRGYAWNDNIGFVSYFCNGATGDKKNETISCGNYDYGVQIGVANSGGAGKRQLKGYAWNEAFGYINFYCNAGTDGMGNACGAFNYGVTRDEATGNLSGYAFSQAGIYMNYSGTNMQFDQIKPVISWCNNKPYACVEVRPSLDDLDFSLNPGLEKSYKLADGTDGYEIHLFLREPDGVTPLIDANYRVDEFFTSLNFAWTDTVKLDQRADASKKVGTYFNDKETPFTDAINRNGAIVYKPITGLSRDLALVNCVGGKEKVFKRDPADASHYILCGKISSKASTYDGNMSYTTSLNPPVLISNEMFLYNYANVLKTNIEFNKLLLNSITYSLKNAAGTFVKNSEVIYPNGVTGLSFKFRPLFELNTLYANDHEDRIVGYRGIPVNFKIGSRFLGSAVPAHAIALFLDYDTDQTAGSCSGLNSLFKFDFSYELDGTTEKADPKNSFSGLNYSSFSSPIDLIGVPTIEDDGESLPCDTAQGPGLYSLINYKIPGDSLARSVYYYANKIPRLAGDVIGNPAAVVYGLVYLQTSFTPSKEVESTQLGGSVNTDTIRRTVQANLKKYVLGKTVNSSASACTVSSVENRTVAGCTSDKSYKFDVKNESVLYFKRSNVIMSDSAEWTKTKIIIADGGNIFIDKDLYTADMTNKRLYLVAFRNHDQTVAQAGNIYIHPDVKNIDAVIVADGAVYSYSGDKTAAGINSTTGQPIWSSYSQMITVLKNQFLLRGGIYSRNTIGGADMDTPKSGKIGEAKTFLLLGGGDTVEIADRIKAQVEDLNYLRFLRMGVEMDQYGYPVDQACDKGLTNEDVQKIFEGEDVLGADGVTLCDGINAVAEPPDGDLVPPSDPTVYARGLDSTKDFGPVYIIKVAPLKDSFLFADSGSLN